MKMEKRIEKALEAEKGPLTWLDIVGIISGIAGLSALYIAVGYLSCFGV